MGVATVKVRSTCMTATVASRWGPETDDLRDIPDGARTAGDGRVVA
jgi:hypothetical protein